jgi:hypothetical protein
LGFLIRCKDFRSFPNRQEPAHSGSLGELVSDPLDGTALALWMSAADISIPIGRKA